jgi:hypothetical protein
MTPSLIRQNTPETVIISFKSIAIQDCLNSYILIFPMSSMDLPSPSATPAQPSRPWPPADSLFCARPRLVNPHPISFWSSFNQDLKPRLSKEYDDFLEREFQKNNKPNSNLKKAIAEKVGVGVDRVNVCTPKSGDIVHSFTFFI